MFAVRPVREGDLPALVALAASIDGGLTSLPADADVLAEKIAESVRAFSPKINKPRGEHYLFVLEDTASGEVVGTSGIASRVGGYEPWYSYELRTEKFVHRPLKIEKEIASLHLKKEHRGPTELCSLYVRPDRRTGGNGRLLSLARLAFVAAFRSRFTDTVIAELRGFLDTNGHSPFWDAVGRVFFESDFYHVDGLSGLGDKDFIAALMPTHPIYVPLLPAAVQAVIGRVHRDTLPAWELLRHEGFCATREVDIFDAGPLVRAETDSIRTVQQSRSAVIAGFQPSGDHAGSQIITNDSLEFRACVGSLAGEDGQKMLSDPVKDALRIRVGDRIRFSPLK